MASYPQVLSAFAGAGGLDLAVRIIAPQARTVCYIERETRTAVNLMARMEDKALDPAPVWDQVETFDGRLWRNVVDWIIASPPCQPFSLAGKKRGDRDHRAFGEGVGPLAGLLRIIDEIQPTVVFLENVPAWITAGWFRSFGNVLAGMGYSIPQPVFLAAQDLGFPHKRERVFILAYTDRNGAQRDQSADRAGGGLESDSQELANTQGQCRRTADNKTGTFPRENTRQDTGRSGCQLGNTHGERRRKAGGGGTPEEIRPASTGAELANTGSAGLQGQLPAGPEAEAAGGSGGTVLPVFPPGSGIDDIPEWFGIFSQPEGWRYAPALPKSCIRGMVDGLAGRVDRLRLIGNGVVPVAAAVALAILLRRADIEPELWEIE